MCWPRCWMWDKLSWCPEKRLLCKDSRINFLTYQNIENPVIHQNKEIQIVVNILLTEKSEKILYILSKFLKKGMSHYGLLPPIFLWHKAAKIIRVNISFFISCKIACIANIQHTATFLSVCICICTFGNFSRSINSCSKFGDLRIFYIRSIKILS